MHSTYGVKLICVCRSTHQFNSVGWTHTLKAVLLGCFVLVIEADISPNRVYSHSLWHIRTQLREATCFSLPEFRGRFNSLSKATTQESSLKDTLVLCFRRRFTAIWEMLDLPGQMRFALLHRKNLATPANTRQFNSVFWMHTLKTVLLGSSVLVLEADI